MDDIKALAEYVIMTQCTVRAAAAVFGISKSTVHKHLTKTLREVSPSLWARVCKVLENNKAQRHIRGGIATREKWKRER